MNEDFSELRRKAISNISKALPSNMTKYGDDLKNLIEELSIHQMELEYQNEELLRAQSELQKVTNLFKDLFENSPTGHVVLSKDCTIVNVNSTLCSLISESKDDIIGKSFEDLVEDHFRDVFVFFFKQIAKGTENQQIELMLKTRQKGGVYVRIDASASLSFDFFRLTLTNITVRKRLEEELRRETERAILSEQKFRQIVERSSDVFLYFDLNTRTASYVSPVVKNIFGYSAQSCINVPVQRLLNIVLPQYREDIAHIIDTLINSDLDQTDNYSMDYQMFTRTSDVLWIRGYFSLIRDNIGTPTQIIATLHDITQRKQYEFRLLKDKEIAESNDSLKTSFLANISHEIRTPLNAIMGFSDLLLERYSSVFDDLSLQYMKIINNNGRDLLELINDIILMAKLESKQMDIHITKFDLNELMRDCYDSFVLLSKNKGIKLSCNDSDVPLYIYSDKDKVLSCFRNLINNALKYTDTGTVEYNATVDDDNVLHFYVKDTGIGIEDSQKEMIFERFAQVKDTITTQGVGLGLSIVKSIMDMLEGKIEFDSTYGKGSTFTLTIPLQYEESQLL